MWLLFAALLFALPAAAQPAKRTVRVSCGINKALYLDEKGRPQGYCSEYLQDLAEINGWQLEYVEGSWSDSVRNLYDGSIDLLFPTQLTETRQEKMGFSTAIGGYQPIGLFARADSPLCYDDYAGFDGARVALSTGTSNEAALAAYAAANGFDYTAINLNTTAEKMQALEDGSVDMIVFSTLNDVENGKVVAMLDYLPFYYCTRIDDTALLDELNTGMKEMLLRHTDVVQEVFYSFMNKNIRFAYTSAEQAEIENHGKVRIGIYQNTAPLFAVDKDGAFSGIYVDLVERIRALSGLDIELVPLDRGERLFDHLGSTVDFVMGASDQATLDPQAQAYLLSEGVMDYYTIGITKSNFSLSEQDDITFALTGGRRYWETAIRTRCPNAHFSYYQTSKQCLNAVQSGAADATMLNSWEYNYQSKNQKYESLIEWENTRTLTQTVFISTDGQNELIRSVLNKSIEQISNAEKEGIITANLNRPYSEYDASDRVYEMRGLLFVFACLLLVVAVGAAVYGVTHRSAMRALEQTNRRLQSAGEAKDRFLSRMSHELRTPLNAINGYATVMQQDLGANAIDPGKMRLQLESILRAAKYQLAIIGDLLDIQQIEAGKLELHPTAVDLTAYMENIVEMIRPEAAEKQVLFTYKSLSKTEESYSVDGVRFEQVLLNLLHNAIKFTPAGGSVTMTAEVVDRDEVSDTLKFVVADTGIGMSEDFQQNYLFHRFAQEYQGNTSPYEGCGTGLAISRELLHLMGGEITCKSVRGEGSTFTVILTLKHAGKKPRRRARRAVPAYDLGGIRVLLCEDNKMNQDMERHLLERMRASVDIADDGQIGVNTFAASAVGHYDLVLMDIRMPNLDGLEATRAIRALTRPDAKTVPILAVSANAFEEDVQKSLAAGMNEHLAKPVDARVLYDTILRHCKTAPPKP